MCVSGDTRSTPEDKVMLASIDALNRLQRAYAHASLWHAASPSLEARRQHPCWRRPQVRMCWEFIEYIR